MLSELGNFRRNDRLAIWLGLIPHEVFLMIILGDVEILDRFHFRNDGAVPDILRIQLADEILGSLFLLWRMIVDAGAVL